MKTFQDWAQESGSDIFEMAQVVTPPEGGPTIINAYELWGKGVVNAINALGGSARIGELVDAMFDGTKIRFAGTQDDFVSLSKFAADNNEPEEKFVNFLKNATKDSIRKQKVKWGDRIMVEPVSNLWKVIAGGDRPKSVGGKAKDNYVPSSYRPKVTAPVEQAPELAPEPEAAPAPEEAPVRTRRPRVDRG